ncbi:MAG: hypothetical protein U1E52_02895 [Geminicoccaceae bacterium]
MRRVTLAEKAAGILARQKLVGAPDAGWIERARNKGASRAHSKRALLAVLDVEARRRGREPVFNSYF